MAAFWGPKQVDTVRCTLQSLKVTWDHLEESVRIYATTWASMATIFPVCKGGPTLGRRGDSLTSSGWSVAICHLCLGRCAIFASTSECTGVCQNGQHSPSDMWSMRDSEVAIFLAAGS